MTIKKTVTQDMNVKTLHIHAGIRFWGDATVNGQRDRNGTLIPCRDDNYWNPIIEVDSGKIINWRENTKADIQYELWRDIKCTFFDSEGNEVLKIEGYMPDLMLPTGYGYSNLILMDVDENGVIQRWNPDLFDFDDTGK